MDINEYAKTAISTLAKDYEYGDIDAQLMGQVLGLSGESGEVLEKFKKLLRDKQGKLSDEDRAEIIKNSAISCGMSIRWRTCSAPASKRSPGSTTKNCSRANSAANYAAAAIIAKNLQNQPTD
mgnify:CR=1 FL=1